MTAISVLVPYRPDYGHRDRIWAWLERRWRELVPEAELIVATDDGGDHPGHFNHPLAINRAAQRATGDVFIVADCDTAFHPGWVRHAAELVASGRAPWVLPLEYHKLTRDSTEDLLNGPPDAQLHSYDAEWVGQGINWSGLVVVHRSGFNEIGGYDERFEFWGADDVCFGLTMDALRGRHLRLEGCAMHFWHPAPHDETYGHERHPEQNALMERYTTAAEDPAALRAVRFG